MRVGNLHIESRRGGPGPVETAGGSIRLNADEDWVVRGPEAELSAIKEALPERVCEQMKELLLVGFDNLVGRYTVPYLGTLEVLSGKWTEQDYERMLGDITSEMMALPFSAGDSGSLPYDRQLARNDDVVYQAFVYLRHILSDRAPRSAQLLPALEAIRREPHYRLERESRRSPLALAARGQPRFFERLAAGMEELIRAPQRLASLSLAQALRGRLPPTVEEARVRREVDTAENRFVKNFLELADAVIGRVEGICQLEKKKDKRFWRRTLDDCRGMKRALAPYRRGLLWDSVGRMHRLPAGSTVLQRRRGYREVYGHFLKLRATSRLLFAEDARDMLEVKDIAALFEMWCYFQVVASITSWLGPPLRVDTVKRTDTHVLLGNGFLIEWSGQICCHYNLAFSRTHTGTRRSYSVGLRPDIVVELPGEDGVELHGLDAKFKVTAASSDQGLGKVKPEDVHKMHAYRDAIPRMKSVWALYPGDTPMFYDSGESGLSGVGAIPLTPRNVEHLRDRVGGMLRRNPTASHSVSQRIVP